MNPAKSIDVLWTCKEGTHTILVQEKDGKLVLVDKDANLYSYPGKQHPWGIMPSATIPNMTIDEFITTYIGTNKDFKNGTFSSKSSSGGKRRQSRHRRHRRTTKKALRRTKKASKTRRHRSRR